MTACALPLRAGAQPAATLAPGTPLAFVVETRVTAATAHAGASYRVHLQADLSAGDTVVAKAGTPARLLIVDTIHDGDGASMRIAFGGFFIDAAGATLPLAAASPVVERLEPGTAIAARTTARLEASEARIVIRAPLPFPLTTDAPNAAFTAQPYRTPEPVVPRR